MQSSISDPAEAKETILARAREEGFDCVGFTAPQLPKGAADDLKNFLDQGLHGDMTWMATNAERRSDPKKLWAGARSVITVGVNYAPKEDPMAASNARALGAISVYAQGADYHDVLKRKLKH